MTKSKGKTNEETLRDETGKVETESADGAEGISGEAGAESGPKESSGGSAGADAEQPAEIADESADTKYLRLAADFQNYKRRTEKERFERYSEGKKDFAADILPVIDNFDRALAQDAAKATDEHDRMFIEGMEMILKQLLDALTKNGVAEIDALGEDFDPNVHHAVVMEPSDEYESQKVSEVLLKGYRIGDKVIRPTMVKVAE